MRPNSGAAPDRDKFELDAGLRSDGQNNAEPKVGVAAIGRNAHAVG